MKKKEKYFTTEEENQKRAKENWGQMLRVQLLVNLAKESEVERVIKIILPIVLKARDLGYEAGYNDAKNNKL